MRGLHQDIPAELPAPFTQNENFLVLFALAHVSAKPALRLVHATLADFKKRTLSQD